MRRSEHGKAWIDGCTESTRHGVDGVLVQKGLVIFSLEGLAMDTPRKIVTWAGLACMEKRMGFASSIEVLRAPANDDCVLKEVYSTSRAGACEKGAQINNWLFFPAAFSTWRTGCTD